MFPMISQSLMGLKNQGVMVLNGATQGNSYPIHFVIRYSKPFYHNV